MTVKFDVGNYSKFYQVNSGKIDVDSIKDVDQAQVIVGVGESKLQSAKIKAIAIAVVGVALAAIASIALVVVIHNLAYTALYSYMTVGLSSYWGRTAISHIDDVINFSLKGLFVPLALGGIALLFKKFALPVLKNEFNSVNNLSHQVQQVRDQRDQLLNNKVK